MMCPITGSQCNRDRCGWWSENSQQCAVLVAAESMRKVVKK